MVFIAVENCKPARIRPEKGGKMFPVSRFFVHIVIVFTAALFLIAKQNLQAAAYRQNPALEKNTFKAAGSHETQKPARAVAEKKRPYQPQELVRIDFSRGNFQCATAANGNLDAAEPAAMPSCGQSDGHMPALLNLFMKTEVMAEKNIAETLVHFYNRHPALIWSENGSINKQARTILAYLAKAADDGLDPAEYMPEMPSEGQIRPDVLAGFDIALSARVLRYVSDASGGRIRANRLSAYYDLPEKKIDLDTALARIRNSDNPAKALASYQPQSKWYIALKIELAALDDIKILAFLSVAPDILIRPGAMSEELPKVINLLMTRSSSAFQEKYHGLLSRHSQATLYSKELEPVIRAYQKSVGKTADGIIGPHTVAALHRDSFQVRRQRILYAMERLRWLPDNFSDRYVFINQPAFAAQYFEKGMEKLAMKAVIGSPRHPTNFFYDRIRLIIFNPSWGVPRSIMMNEMMPRILTDSSYLRRRGFLVYDSKGKQLDPDRVNWRKAARTGGIYVRQKPGPHNALGKLKIIFPNRHDIYLHDTPAKSVFARDMRAVSHGCVRLARPEDMAAAVMGITAEKLRPYFSGNERTVLLKETVPVYLVYFTAWPDAATGEIKYYDDVYSLDNALQQADEKIRHSRYLETACHNG